MKKFKLCLLHIGSAKTATTSIQASFALNRKKLADRGYYYPATPGIENHTKLAVYSIDDARMTGSKRRALDSWDGNVGAFRKNLRSQMDAEFRRVRQQTLLLSNEHLQLHLISVDEKRRLKSLLDQWCDDYRIIIYLRRQDKFAVSLFSTHLTAGATDFDSVLPKLDTPSRNFYNYKKLLEEYGEVFGIKKVAPAIFEREKFFRGDIIEDIYQRIGVGDTEHFEKTAPENKSLSFQAQAFLADFNVHTPRFLGSKSNPAHKDITKLLGRRYIGRGKTVTRSAAAAFLQQFADSNEWVRQTFFPQQEKLFSVDFSGYPEAINQDVNSADMVEIAAYLLQEQHKTLNSPSQQLLNFLNLIGASITRHIKSPKSLTTRNPQATLRIIRDYWKSTANS